jgi:hypothetical protein
MLLYCGEKRRHKQVSVTISAACMCVTGSMRSTPTSALEVLLMLPPLSILIEKESRHAAYRLKDTGRLNRAIVGHSEILARMIEETPILGAPSDKISVEFSVEYPSRADWLDSTNGVTFYTDGSLLNGQAGAGLYSESQNTRETYALGTQDTVFQSEVTSPQKSNLWCLLNRGRVCIP